MTDEYSPREVETDEAMNAADETRETAADGAMDAPRGRSAAGKTARRRLNRIINSGVYTHAFRTPYTYEGKKYESITFDFTRLTGQDMIDTEIEMQDRGEFAISPEHSRLLQCYLASKAANIGSDVLATMPLNDFNRITNAARAFLMSTGF
jgi:hypothetical protein